jgi:hypothetical protein
MRNTREIDVQIGASVTTSQLLLPSQRGKAAFWLPIPLPNSDLLANECSDVGGGAGGSQTTTPKAAYR